MMEEHQAKMEAEAEAEKEREKSGGKKRKKLTPEEEEKAEEKERARKVKKFMKQQEAADVEADKMLATDERERKYGAHVGSADKPSEEEMEAWRLRQSRGDDPLANFDGPGFL